MNNTIHILRAVANSFIPTLFLFLFLDKMYERKYQNKYILFFAYAVSVLVTWITTMLQMPFVNAIRTIALINLVCIFLYKAKMKSAIIYNIVFVIATIFVDITTVSLLGAFLKQSSVEILGSFQEMVISNLLYWLCLFLVYKLLVHLFKRNYQDKVQTKEIIFLLFITSFEMFVVLYIITLTQSEIQGVYLTIILLGFLLINLYYTRLLTNIGKISQLKSELALSNQQSKMQLKYYQGLLQKNNLSRTIAHDIRNHIQTLEALYSIGENKEAQGYRGALDEQIDKLSYGFNCGNLILSIIVSHHLQQAEINGIVLNLEVEDIPMDFIADLDLTAIFANLLDNAIEACSELEEKSRHIQLIIRLINGFIAVRISNPIKDIPQRKDNVFKTSKQHHEGIGLTNVSNAVEKYGGSFSAEIENGQFVVKITISTPM